MGTILNTLPLEKIDNLGDITPDRADWLTSHADATGLSVVEVERLWHRYQQITNSNRKTTFAPEKNPLPEDLSNDIFMKNMLKHIPRLKTDDDVIPFGYFIVVMKWLEEASIRKKLEAVFVYINNGDPIDVVFLNKLMKHMNPEKNDEEIKEISIELMMELDSTDNGQINQQEFVDGIQKLMPRSQLEHILQFHIIPTRLVEETDKLPALTVPPPAVHKTSDPDVSDLVTENQLKEIAVRSAKRHWTKLALALGFLEYDIEAYKARNKYNSEATIYELLELWRDQETVFATKTRLREYLKISGFEGLVPILK